MRESRGDVVITTRAAVAAIGLVAALYVASLMPDVLVVCFVCLILAAALAPGVRWFERRLGWSRLAGTSAVFALMLAACTGAGYLVVPSLVQQANDLIAQAPQVAAQLRETYTWAQHAQGRLPLLPKLEEAIQTLSSFAAGWLASSLGVAGQAFNVLGTVSLVLIATFFLLLESDELRRGAVALVPIAHRETFAEQLGPIAEKLGGFVRGTMFTVGFLVVYLGITLTLAGVPLSLALTMLAGLMEIIPMVGSLLGVIPAFFIALTVSWKLALVVLGIFAVGNFIQGNFVQPWVMARSVDVSPVMVMLALLVGAKLMGLGGALIAVPLLATIHVLVQNLYIAPMEEKACLMPTITIMPETPAEASTPAPEGTGVE